jgi:hypothetical protein
LATEVKARTDYNASFSSSQAMTMILKLVLVEVQILNFILTKLSIALIYTRFLMLATAQELTVLDGLISAEEGSMY